MERRVAIEVADVGLVSGALSLPESEPDLAPRRTGIVLAHGAGGNMDLPLLAHFARDLAAAGHPVLRFNFPYSEKGRKAPDRPPVLAAAWEAAYRAFSMESGVDSIVAAGKSMGGRIASELAAAGRLPVAGLVFLGYPLHPPGRSERVRDEHLYRIQVPMLFFAGTRDSLCNLELLKGVLDRIEAPTRLEVVEGGDHSFNVPHSAGISTVEINARLASRTVSWLSGIRT
ncbi:MAG: alpha/beta fold hydrolase [Deltaproteobacteria bacterium]|nr:alpha/beta fold hydrolase [Deltaproteobacteria bacterium]